MPNYRDYGGDQNDRRIDAFDVIEGMLKDGFSLSSFSRIARARGSNFWIGAALGATAVVLFSKPEARAAAASFFHAKTSPNPTHPTLPEGASANTPAPSSGA